MKKIIFHFLILVIGFFIILSLGGSSPDGGRTISFNPIGIMGLIILIFGLFGITENPKIKKFLEKRF